jgi:hypothetical protein
MTDDENKYYNELRNIGGIWNITLTALLIVVEAICLSKISFKRMDWLGKLTISAYTFASLL